jgi:hypothetical protein
VEELLIRAPAGAALIVFGTCGAACATLLDFPDRAADPGDGSAAGGGAGIAASGGGGGAPGSGGLGASGGGAAAGGSGGGPEEGGPADAEPDGDAADGPPFEDASSPGMIRCGSQFCPAGSGQTCCADPTTGLGECTPINQCSNPNLKILCDEVTDCLTGTVCCAELLGGLGLAFGASCRNACTGPNTPVQLCSSSAECKQGACALRTCQGGAQILACTSTNACQ